MLLSAAALGAALVGLALTFTPAGWGWGVSGALLALVAAGPAWDRSRSERVAHLLAWVAIVVALAAVLLHLLVYLETLPLRPRG